MKRRRHGQNITITRLHKLPFPFWYPLASPYAREQGYSSGEGLVRNNIPHQVEWDVKVWHYNCFLLRQLSTVSKPKSSPFSFEGADASRSLHSAGGNERGAPAESSAFLCEVGQERKRVGMRSGSTIPPRYRKISCPREDLQPCPEPLPLCRFQGVAVSRCKIR